MRVSGWHSGEFRIAAIGVPPGVARLCAQILVAASAELALPTGVSEPRYSDPVADRELSTRRFLQTDFDDFADDLVTRDHFLPVHR
jgi:hypothetical protein